MSYSLVCGSFAWVLSADGPIVRGGAAWCGAGITRVFSPRLPDPDCPHTSGNNIRTLSPPSPYISPSLFLYLYLTSSYSFLLSLSVTEGNLSSFILISPNFLLFIASVLTVTKPYFNEILSFLQAILYQNYYLTKSKECLWQSLYLIFFLFSYLYFSLFPFLFWILYLSPFLFNLYTDPLCCGITFLRDQNHRVNVYVPSEAYTTPDIVKGGRRALPPPPPPSPGCANFSIMIECTPESGNCHSVFMYNLNEIGRGESGVGAQVSVYVMQG